MSSEDKANATPDQDDVEGHRFVRESEDPEPEIALSFGPTLGSCQCR